MKDDFKKIEIRTFEEFPGVKKAWKYRGRVYLLLEKAYAGLFKDLQKVKDLGRCVIMRSKEVVDSKARLEQSFQWNARATKWMVQQHYEHLQHLIQVWSKADPRLDEWLSDEERQQIEDELDELKPRDLSVPEGYIGYYYKEDFDLERGQKQEWHLHS